MFPNQAEINARRARPPRSAGIARAEYHRHARSASCFFWKASLSIELPLTAHDPIHP